MRGWVDIKDEMPMDCQNCLLTVASGKNLDVIIGYYFEAEGAWHTYDECMSQIGSSLVAEGWTVTHWMPLPAPA